MWVQTPRMTLAMPQSTVPPPPSLIVSDSDCPAGEPGPESRQRRHAGGESGQEGVCVSAEVHADDHRRGAHRSRQRSQSPLPHHDSSAGLPTQQLVSPPQQKRVARPTLVRLVLFCCIQTAMYSHLALQSGVCTKEQFKSS